MRWFVLSTCLLSLVCAAPSAWGHGFSLSLSGNTLAASSNDFPGNGNQYLFNASFEDVVGDLSSNHGAAGSNLFGTGKELSFEVRGPFWFATGNGAPAAPARDGLSLLVEGTRAGFPGLIEIDGASTHIDGFAISGNSSHEFLSTLSDDPLFPFAAADQGVYGIMYRVVGNPVGGSAYEPTPWLVSTWMTPGFNPGTDPLSPTSPLSLAQNAIYNAAVAVPEPSTIMLAGAAVLALALIRRRG